MKVNSIIVALNLCYTARNSDAMKNYDCFICAVLTHGTTNKWTGEQKLLFADDFYDLRQLSQIVNNEECKVLQGKPKIFVIQVSLEPP